MDENYKNQTQFELFPDSGDRSSSGDHKNRRFREFTLSGENIIVIIIILVMLFIFSFSIGVERGRKVDASPQKTETTPVKSAPLAQEEKKTSQNSPNDVLLQPQQPDIKEASAPVKVVIQKQVNEVKDKIIKIPLEEIQEAEPVPSGPLFTVQVASFKREENAEKEADRLREFGEEAFIVPKGDYTIVCVGRFSVRDEALELSNRLKKRYNDCLIRSL